MSLLAALTGAAGGAAARAVSMEMTTAPPRSGCAGQRCGCGTPAAESKDMGLGFRGAGGFVPRDLLLSGRKPWRRGGSISAQEEKSIVGAASGGTRGGWGSWRDPCHPERPRPPRRALRPQTPSRRPQKRALLSGRTREGRRFPSPGGPPRLAPSRPSWELLNKRVGKHR